LAQPPEYNETFLREVDENLRRDQLRDFAKKYGWLIAAGVVLFLLASGGFIYWQHYKQQRAEKEVVQFTEVMRNITTGKTAEAQKQLGDLTDSSSKAVRATALFTSAALALEKNDAKSATATFRTIAEDKSLPQPYRDVALLRQTALEFDSLQPQQVIERLAPMAKPGNPWFGSAGEMTAMALIKQGQKPQAAQLFVAIAKDKSVPDSIRARSVQLAGSLGVDASSAFTPAQ
jgi:hypothetical protein